MLSIELSNSNQLTQHNRLLHVALAVGLTASMAACNARPDEAGGAPALSVEQLSATPEPGPATVLPRHAALMPLLNPIVAMQESFNAQLVPLGMPALTLDGKMGGQTSRAACAIRYFTGHAANTATPTPAERSQLSAPHKLASPLTGYIINKTCQVLAVELDGKPGIDMLIPVSTGRPGYDTTSGDFHVTQGTYGYHDSTLYPDPAGLGTMYDSQYFNASEAVHGAPEMTPTTTSPRSHGCARITIPDAIKLWKLAGGPAKGHQDQYIGTLKPIPVHVR